MKSRPMAYETPAISQFLVSGFLFSVSHLIQVLVQDTLFG